MPFLPKENLVGIRRKRYRGDRRQSMNPPAERARAYRVSGLVQPIFSQSKNLDSIGHL